MVSKGQRPSGVMKMIHFIGAGPGDPELITIKGRRLIDEADVIIYAGSLVNPKVLDGHKDTAVIYNSALMDLHEVSRIEIEAAKKGLSVARVHTGDPSIYGAIREQMDLLEKEGIEFDVIPGVSSFVATAAVLKKEYTLPDVSQTDSHLDTHGGSHTDASEGEAHRSCEAQLIDGHIPQREFHGRIMQDVDIL